MQQLAIAAPAKINLSLDVVGKRPDGYHLLSTVMQSIDLVDVVTLKISRKTKGSVDILLDCDLGGIPLDHSNTAWRAAGLFLWHEKMKQAVGDGMRLSIGIRKAIPVAAGLAGGSTDAAAVLYGLAVFFPDQLSQQDLQQIAVQTGADVPFCLQGGTILCEGIGERLTPLPPWPDLPVLLCCPNNELLTAQVFAAYSQVAPNSLARPDTQAVLASIRSKDLAALSACTGNVLTTVARRLRPELEQILQRLRTEGAVLAQMSGSGPSVFGVFHSDRACHEAAASMGVIMPHLRLFSCRTQAAGPTQIIG